MRYLVLTDIHANLDALEACLADARPRGFDQTLVLGDVVGYGAQPNEVIDRVIGLKPVAIVRGNHDKVAAGLEHAEGFNAVARNAAMWTLNALTPEHLQWLQQLPPGPLAVDESVEVCHGAPFDEDEYVFDELDATRAIAVATRPICLFGHTHHAIAFELRDGGLAQIDPDGGSGIVRLRKGSKFLVNPGSVGQPRDGDPRAAYAIVDVDAGTIEMLRVEYPVAEAQRKILAAGLPPSLAQRLAIGH